MKKLVELEVLDGPPVFVEVQGPGVDEDALAGFEPVGRSLARGPREERGGSWREALERVRPAVTQMVEVFREIATPEEVSVEFSLTFNHRVNAFVFSSDAEATLKVGLKWSQKAAVGGRGGA